MISNKDYLVEIAQTFLGENCQIKNIEQWNELLKILNAHKMISNEDQVQIDPGVLIFPLQLEHFVKIITEKFNEPKLRELYKNIQALKEQVNDTKSTITYWNSEGMNHRELKCLLIIFEKLKDELNLIINDFDQMNESVQKIRENINQVKDSFKDAEKLPVKTSFEYQKLEGIAIEKEFNQKKCRGVQYRNQQVKVLKMYASGIIKQIGYDKDQDYPVEVIKIPKLFQQFEINEMWLHTFNAYKELIFSNYYPNFLGFDNISDTKYNLFFIQHIKGKPISVILEQANAKLNPDSLLYKYWIREIFLALKDLLEQTIYVPKLPIKLKQIQISEKGLQINIQHLHFTHMRRQKEDCHEFLETKLLRNYALLILEILGLDETCIESLNQFLEFKNFILTLLYAEEDLQQFLKNETAARVNFNDISFHPMLNQKQQLDRDILKVVEEYESLTDDQLKQQMIQSQMEQEKIEEQQSEEQP